MVEEYKDGNVMIEGDFNARTEKEGRKWESEEDDVDMNVQDEVINAEGEKLLKWSGENGLSIANGNMKGNEGGGVTYVGARGETTID